MARNIGVNIVEGTPVSAIDGVTTGVAAIIGNFERGPLNVATLVTSMSQFERTFGSKPPTLTSKSWYAVKAFFAKVGTGRLYIVRVAHSTAAKATRTFTDRNGSPANTLKIDAKSEGAWGNGITIKVLDFSLLSTVPAVNIPALATSATLQSVDGLEVGSDLKFYNGTNTEYKRLLTVNKTSKQITWSGSLTNAYTTANGVITSVEFKLEVYVDGVLTESFTGLGMCNTTTFFVEKKVLSDYITVTDLKSTDSSYLDLPSVQSTALALSAGADGLSDVVASDYVGTEATKTGLYALDQVSDLFRFACPYPILTDVSPSTAYQSMIQSMVDYADRRVTCQFYADVPAGSSVSSAVTFGNNFSSRRLALFFPWVKVQESGLVISLPPSAFALGVAVEKDYRRGVHKSIGNETIAYGYDLDYNVSVAEGETLNDAGICTIRRLSALGLRIYGARTRSAVTAYRFINFSEYWNYVGKSLEVATQDVPFEPNDRLLWGTVVRRITKFFENEKSKGAVTAYAVQMDDSNNPQDQVALGYATCKVEYVPTGVAEKFTIELTSSPSGLTIAA